MTEDQLDNIATVLAETALQHAGNAADSAGVLMTRQMEMVA